MSGLSFLRFPRLQRGGVLRLLQRADFHLHAGRLRSKPLIWPVNGFLPKRFFLASTWMAETLNRPGRVDSPAPFLWIALTIVFSSWASTVWTVFLSSSVWVTRWVSRLDLLNVFLQRGPGSRGSLLGGSCPYRHQIRACLTGHQPSMSCLASGGSRFSIIGGRLNMPSRKAPVAAGGAVFI